MEWKHNSSVLIPILMEKNVSKFTFFGIVHNTPTIEEHEISELVEVFQRNIEGVFVMNNATIFLVLNHNGEIMILDAVY